MPSPSDRRALRSSTHLAIELLKSLAQVRIAHIPYAGSPQVVTDLLAGRIDGYFSPAPAAMEHVRAGKLVALAVTDPRRSTFMPDLPTMIEAGVPGFESVLWFGIAAPVDTPQPIIDKLASAANEALKSDAVTRSLQAQTIAQIGGSPDEFRRYMETEHKPMGRRRRRQPPGEVTSLFRTRQSSTRGYPLLTPS